MMRSSLLIVGGLKCDNDANLISIENILFPVNAIGIGTIENNILFCNSCL